jgi:hypothetical protein
MITKFKIFENNKGFIELTYYYDQDEVMVDIDNGIVVDIYTYENNGIDFIDWIKGKNNLYVHCPNNQFHIILDELLSSGNSKLYKDEEEDESYYDEIENELQKQLEILTTLSNYNI